MTLDDYLCKHYTKRTAKIYLFDINNYLSNYPEAAGAVYRDVVAYIGTLRTRYNKASTLNRIVSAVKAYYDFLCDVGKRSDNPARSVVLKDQRSRDIQLQDLFTTAELEALLERKERYVHLAYRNKVLMSLLIYQALLPLELEALRIEDIDLSNGMLRVGSSAKTKARALSLRPNQVLLFYEYLQEVRPVLLRGKNSGTLLIGIRGEAMRAEDITKHVKRSYAGWYPGRSVTAQTIRQSVIANQLKAGHDLSIVQLFAGHKYPGSTERYKQHEIETLKAAIQKHHPIK